MANSKFTSLFFIAISLLSFTPMVTGYAAQNQRTAVMVLAQDPNQGWLSEQELRFVLCEALAQWPVSHNYSYGTFRSAYNHGSLYIDPVAHNLGRAANVTFSGITVCVLIPA